MLGKRYHTEKTAKTEQGSISNPKTTFENTVGPNGTVMGRGKDAHPQLGYSNFGTLLAENDVQKVPF